MTECLASGHPPPDTIPIPEQLERPDVVITGVGDSGNIDRSVWNSDALNLLDPSITMPADFQPLLAAVNELRRELAHATGRSLVDDIELSLLRYQPGGQYVRHFDDTSHVGGSRQALRRSLSLLIYLTPSPWRELDGGCLRIYPPAARPYADVPPTGSTCPCTYT